MITATSKETSPTSGDRKDETISSDDRLQASLASDELSTGEEKDEPAWPDDELRQDFELSKTRDEAATNRLLKRLNKTIVAACVKQLRGVYPREERVEELAQEVRIRIWQGLPDCIAKSQRELSGWIFKIAKHKHIDDVRPGKKKDREFVSIELLAERQCPDPTTPEDEARFAEWRDQLSDSEKLIVKLRLEEQLPYEEIGKKLPNRRAGNRAGGNSKSQVQREFYAALAKLGLTCPLPKDTVVRRKKRLEKFVKRKRKEKHGPEQ